VFRYSWIVATALVASPAQAQQPINGPPLERPVSSLSENGEHQLITVYHANRTLDFNVDGKPSGGGTWELAGAQFCFTLDTGNDAGKRTCKNGRLIGRVSLDGTQLAQSNQIPTAPTPPAYIPFIGRWEGAWLGKLPSFLIVHSVDQEGHFRATYGWGTSDTITTPGQVSVSGLITNGVLIFKGKSEFRFKLLGDRALEGKRYTSDLDGYVIMTKVN